MIQPKITHLTRVTFNKDGTTLKGRVLHVISDISNGRKMASVELDHNLPGVIETVPLDQLTVAPLSLNIVFLTSPADCLKPETNDRRFYVIPGIDRQANINTNDCAKIISLVAHLCGFNSKLIEHVLCWLAYPLQNEGKRNPSALVFKQEQGCGISLFFGEVMRPIHSNQFTTISPFCLSQFNPWAKSSRLVLCEDITLGKYSKTPIKNLISLPFITINEKMKESVTIPNEINYVFTSREIPSEFNAESPSHRLICLHPITASDDSFYTDVYSEIKLGGIEAFRKYLLSLDLTEYKRSFGCV